MSNEHMTPSLSRAARAILNWSMDELAERTKLGPTTIRDYENGARSPRRVSRDAIENVFLEAGIQFLGGPGETPGLLVLRPELLDNPPPHRQRKKAKR